jgi:hypothetical protein
MNVYLLTLKYDNGFHYIQTTGSNEYNAKYKVMLSENCPLSAIVDVQFIKSVL